MQNEEILDRLIEMGAVRDYRTETGERDHGVVIRLLLEQPSVLRVPFAFGARPLGGHPAGLGLGHTIRASKMSASEMNPRKMGTSSFSNREKMRRNPFKDRNSLSISLRLLYIARSYCHGLIRVLRGGTMGVNPNANQVAVDGSLRAPDKSHRLNSSSLLTRQQASTVSGYF